MRCSNTDGKGDGALIQVVCAVEHDGRSERVLTLAFEVPSKSFNLHSAILETVKDFLSSEEGRGCGSIIATPLTGQTSRCTSIQHTASVMGFRSLILSGILIRS